MDNYIMKPDDIKWKKRLVTKLTKSFLDPQKSYDSARVCYICCCTGHTPQECKKLNDLKDDPERSDIIETAKRVACYSSEQNVYYFAIKRLMKMLEELFGDQENVKYEASNCPAVFITNFKILAETAVETLKERFDTVTLAEFGVSYQLKYPQHYEFRCHDCLAANCRVYKKQPCKNIVKSFETETKPNYVKYGARMMELLDMFMFWKNNLKQCLEFQRTRQRRLETGHKAPKIEQKRMILIEKVVEFINQKTDEIETQRPQPNRQEPGPSGARKK